MAIARQDFLWSPPSTIVATLMNINRKKGSPEVKPDDIHPLRGKSSRSKGIPITRENLHHLKVLSNVARKKNV